MISKDHSNRSPHNWLIYNIGDRFLSKYGNLYRGELYDLGCGEQAHKDFFLQHCNTYTGVDWGGTLHTPKADVFANLSEPLPFGDAVADTVISLSVMEHLSEPLTMLNESLRILRSGGYIILQVPFMWQVHEAPYDFYRFTRYGLEHLFKKAGFEDIKVEATTGFWVMWFLKLNYQMVRIVRGPKLLRAITRMMLVPFWWLDQHLAELLDRYWPNSERETAGYFVVARKP